MALELLTFLLILSSGGVAFTDLQHPTNTHRLAVAMMLRFTGMGTNAGRAARIARATSALVAGLFIFAPLLKTGLTVNWSAWSMILQLVSRSQFCTKTTLTSTLGFQSVPTPDHSVLCKRTEQNPGIFIVFFEICGLKTHGLRNDAQAKQSASS
jgi:hypothetical protein